MAFTKVEAVRLAKDDLASRSGISASNVKEVSVVETEFPDMSLGLPVKDEVSAQMISGGWTIVLDAEGKRYEYRADKYQVRFKGSDGVNYLLS